MSYLERSLYKLFSEYSMQANIYKHNQLRVQRLVELYEDASLFDDEFKEPQLQMLLSSVNARSAHVSFQKFCELIGKVAECRYPKEFAESPSEAYGLIITDHFFPLAFTTSNYLAVINRQDLNLSNNITSIAKSLHKSFKTIYRRSFPWEMKALPLDQHFSMSLKKFEQLLKEFEIYPSIINKVKMHGIWRDIVVMQDEKFSEYVSSALLPKGTTDAGRIFTLSKFILTFYFCSVYGYQENLLIPESVTEKFVGLLERAHLSVSKTNKSLNLIPPKSLMANIQRQERNADTEGKSQENTASSDISLDQEAAEVIEKHIDKLQSKFLEYCRGVNSVLSRSSFFKFLRDTNLMSERISSSEEKLGTTDADLIFTQAKRRNVMDFRGFLKALELVTKKISRAPLQGALEAIISEHVFLPTEETKNDANQGNPRDKVVVKTLRMLQKPVAYLYNYLADSKGRMNFERFVKALKEFELFPDLLSKSKLAKMFVNLTRTPETLLNSDSHDEFIKLKEFMEALALVALEIEYSEEVSYPEKICLLVERIFQSHGAQRIYKEMGHFRNQSNDVNETLDLIRGRFKTSFRSPSKRNISFEEFAVSFSMQSNSFLSH